MTDEQHQENAKTSKSRREELLDAVEQAWRRLEGNQFFFVPSLDTDTDEKKVLSRGYQPRRKPPKVVPGIYRGQWGLICYRTTPPGLQKTAKRALFADS
jgi:hypothetical protein